MDFQSWLSILGMNSIFILAIPKEIPHPFFWREFYLHGKVGPQHCNEAVQREYDMKGEVKFRRMGDGEESGITIDKLIELETAWRSKGVASYVRVVDSDKTTVVVEPSVLEVGSNRHE